MVGSIQADTYTGTGSAINIPLGWVPDFVITFNVTDATTAGIWFNGMTDDTAIDLALALAPNAAGGISALSSTTLGYGFTVGADYSVSAKVYRYLAFKAG